MLMLNIFLGGGQQSLKYNYKKVAEIFRSGLRKEIWILRREGKTEYNPSLRRNLSNDEWSLKTLKNSGVPSENFVPIKVREGLLGTYSEAKGISSFVRNNKYKSTMLVSTPSHTGRVKSSFEYFNKENNFTIHILTSEEKSLLSF